MEFEERPMNESHLDRARHSFPARRSLAASLAFVPAFFLAGCSHEHREEVRSVTEPPAVQVIRPQTRDIVRVVKQPSFVEAYERTSIYPKLAGYIEKWYVDIGDPVRKDQVLADLFVPEIVEEWKKKGAIVEYDRRCVALAEKAVLVAAADVRVATANLKAAKATWAQYHDEAERWQSEVKRLRGEEDRGVLDAQTLLESENRHRGCIALREAAAADVLKAEADLESKRATLGEDQVAVKVAKADVEVAESDWKRLGAWADTGPGMKPYIKLYAPFDGVVVARNANTWDFVLPAVGDPSADTNAPYLSPSGQAAPIYVIDRTDVVRIFIDIPEHSANYVKVGTQGSVLVKAFRDQPLFGMVTRTSWALNVTTRTLRAEIDLPNVGSKIPDDVPSVVHDAISDVKLPQTESQILPGMYAYGKVIIERPHVHALPKAALFYVGQRAYCYTHESGKAVRIEVQTGLSDTKNKWVEVTNRRRVRATDLGLHKASYPATVAPAATDEVRLAEPGWVPFDGSEEVILGDLSILTDGERVRVTGDGEPQPTRLESQGI
jgi:HlyD family secretion protein